MSIDVGEQTNDYQEIAAKDKLSDLQLRVRQLLDQAEQISKEQNYQRVCSAHVTYTFVLLFCVFGITLALLGIDGIILILQQNRLRWFGHVLRKEDTDSMKK